MKIRIDIDVQGACLEVEQPEAELRRLLEQALAYLVRDGELGEGERKLRDTNGNTVGYVVVFEPGF